MSPLNVPKSESGYGVVPAGNHVAKLYSIIHIGTVPEVYLGEEKMMNKVLIGFELLNEKKVFKEDKGEEPYVISKEYTLSMNEKANLRKLIEGMLGVALNEDEAESFDVFSLLGQECLVNVVHKVSAKGSTYALIASASPVPKGMLVPKGHNQFKKLSYGADWNEEIYNSLPDFIRAKIGKSNEFRKERGITTPFDPNEIPF